MLQSLNRHYIAPIRSFNRAARLFLLMTIIDGVIFSAWQLFFNFYMLQSGYSREFLGLVNSLPSAGALIFGLLVGRISDRIGRKPSLIIGIGVTSIFMLMQITFRQPVIIAVSAFFFGVFNMLFLISQAPLMVKLSGAENRTMLFSLNYGLQTISGAVGSLFAGQLPAYFGVLLNVQAQSATAYQAVLIVSILLGLTSLIPIWMMKEPAALSSTDTPQVSTVRTSLQPEEVATASPSGKKLSPALISLTAKMTVPQILIGFGAAILIPYMNVFFKFRYDISDSDLGILFSISSLLIGIGSIMAPWLSTRMGGKVRAVVVTQFGSLVFLLMTGFAPFLWLSSIGYLLRTALMNMSAPLYSAFCMERTPEHHQGLVNSVLNLAWNIGWSVGPFISGVVQEHYGFTPLFIATSVLYFIAIVAAWTFFKNTEKLQPLPLAIVQIPESLD